MLGETTNGEAKPLDVAEVADPVDVVLALTPVDVSDGAGTVADPPIGESPVFDVAVVPNDDPEFNVVPLVTSGESDADATDATTEATEAATSRNVVEAADAESLGWTTVEVERKGADEDKVLTETEREDAMSLAIALVDADCDDSVAVTVATTTTTVDEAVGGLSAAEFVSELASVDDN